MVALPIHRPVTVSLTPSIAIAAAACVATVALVLPSALLESLVLDSGIPAILPAAEPPLGYTARALLAMIAGGGAGAVSWLAAYLAFGGEGIVTLTPRRRLPASPMLVETPDPAPVLRRAHAHPDAPPRAPLNATRELGQPFLQVRAPVEPVERPLPRDLDAPLAAFDPAAIPAVAAAPAEPVRPLAALKIAADLDPGERFESFELPRPTPAPSDPAPIAAPRTDATIHALLDRLERGVADRRRRPSTARRATLADTLDELRGLAAR